MNRLSMIKAPQQIRGEVMAMCKAFAAACGTQNQYVVNAVATAIEVVDLPRLIPDKPTLASVLAAQNSVALAASSTP